MNKILLTGCAGFIGSHLSELLLDKGYNVVGIDNFDSFYSAGIKKRNLQKCFSNRNFNFIETDIRSSEAINNIHSDIDVVIHIAAKAGVLPSIKDADGYIDSNIKGTNNILDWMKERSIKKMVFASSSSVYGNSKEIPFKESQSMDKLISPYAYTKRSCELLNYVYHHLYGINVLNLRFFTVYGPRQRPDLAIHKFVKMIDEGKPVTMYGDGSTARDYTYVSDTVLGIFNAMNYLMNSNMVFDTVNLGNNHPVTLKDLIDLLYELMNKKPDIIQLPMQPGDVDVTYADITKARSLFNYQPSKPFRDGLIDFINWYNEQKN